MRQTPRRLAHEVVVGGEHDPSQLVGAIQHQCVIGLIEPVVLCAENVDFRRRNPSAMAP